MRSQQDDLLLYDRLSGEARLLDFDTQIQVVHALEIEHLVGNWLITCGDLIGQGRAQVVLYGPGNGDAHLLAFAADLRSVHLFEEEERLTLAHPFHPYDNRLQAFQRLGVATEQHLEQVATMVSAGLFMNWRAEASVSQNVRFLREERVSFLSRGWITSHAYPLPPDHQAHAHHQR